MRSANEWNNKGVALKAKGDLEGALQAYDQALALNPKDAFAWTNKGVALKAKGDLERALQAYDQAIVLNPKDAAPWNNKGAALKAKGDLKGALQAYDQALALDPKYAAPWTNKGAALQAKGDLKGALQAYDQAIALDPKDAAPWTNKGNVLQAKGDLEGALQAYDQALALDPKNALAWTNKGNVLQAKGDLEGALQAHDQALALNPKQAVAWTNKGNVLQAKGDLEGALQAYDQALALDPKYALAWTNKGNVLQAKGDLERASQAFERAVGFRPPPIGTQLRTHQQKQETLTVLNRLDSPTALSEPTPAQDPTPLTVDNGLPHSVNAPANTDQLPVAPHASSMFTLQIAYTAVDVHRLQQAYYAPATTLANSGNQNPMPFIPKAPPTLESILPTFQPFLKPELAHETKCQIGRWGEGLVYGVLKAHYEAKYHITLTDNPDLPGFAFSHGTITLTVTWHNFGLPAEQDRRHPHDITLTKTKDGHARPTRCVEVKTTPKVKPTEVKFSQNQVQEMFQYQQRYRVFRVYGAGQPHTFFRVFKHPAKLIFGRDAPMPTAPPLEGIKLKL